MAVKILVDSGSDISAVEAKEKGIYMIPMAISFGMDEFYDGVDLLPLDFFDKLVKSKEIPKTSQISEFRFVEALKPIVEEGNEVVLITISSKISQTFNNAKRAAEQFEGKVFAVDSMIASTGIRVQVDYALRLIEQGKSAKEIKDELDRVKGKVCLLAVMDTLEYLAKGGRISALAAKVGNALSIKPIINFIDGEVKAVGKAFGHKKGCHLMNSMVKDKGGIDLSMPCCAMWSGTDKSGIDKYVADNASLWNANGNDDIDVHLIGGTIGTHIGPDAVGLAFFTK